MLDHNEQPEHIQQWFKWEPQGVTAERVLLDHRPPAQMPVACSTAQQDLLQQVPDCLWSKHKTDVGLVKSQQRVKVILKTGARLPYQRQYPLLLHALAGIKPIIGGLLEVAILVRTKSPCNSLIFLIKKSHSNDSWWYMA